MSTLSPSYSGTWVARVDGRNFIVVSIAAPTLGDFSGQLCRPAQFALKDDLLERVSRQILCERAERPSLVKDKLTFVAEGPKGPSDQDRYTLQLISHDSGRLSLTDLPGVSVSVSRSVVNEKVSDQWSSDQTYGIKAPDPTSPPAHNNAEIARLFEDDQSDRAGHVAPQVLASRDAVRLGKAKKLLSDGSLKTAEDFYFASFVFSTGPLHRTICERMFLH